MLYEYGKHTRDFFEAFTFFFKFSLLYFGGIVGYEMIIANLVLCALAIYHLISNVCLWNNC